MNKVTNTFKRARELLGIKVIAPFVFCFENREYKCAAFFPDYGGVKGTLVKTTTPPNFETDAQFAADATKSNYHWSYINIENLMEFDQVFFEEILLDWGKN